MSLRHFCVFTLTLSLWAVSTHGQSTPTDGADSTTGSTPPVEPASQSANARNDSGFFHSSFDLLHSVVDYFPDLVERTLPGLDPSGSYRIYVRPHFGDFFHRDYVRLPLGIKWKVSERLELSSEVEGYLTHGLRGDGDGNGFSRVRFGSKYEFTTGRENNLGVSTGFNFFSPVGHPPRGLSDGMRHLQPYVAFTKPIAPRWGLIGFATFGMDFLSHSNINPNFGGNQLHTNNLGVAFGAAKGWRYVYSSITATVVTGKFISDEGRQVYDLKPEFTVPLRMISGPRANFLLTFTGHLTEGPDGWDQGLGTSLRVEWNFHHRSAP